MKSCLDSTLFFESICSIRTRSRNRDILKNYCRLSLSLTIKNQAKLIEEFPTDAALEAYSQQYYDLCRRENIKEFLIHLATNVKLKVLFYNYFGVSGDRHFSVKTPFRTIWPGQSRLHQNESPRNTPVTQDFFSQIILGLEIPWFGLARIPRRCCR